jgi:hypothetical protein
MQVLPVTDIFEISNTLSTTNTIPQKRKASVDTNIISHNKKKGRTTNKTTGKMATDQTPTNANASSSKTDIAMDMA